MIMIIYLNKKIKIISLGQTIKLFDNEIYFAMMGCER